MWNKVPARETLFTSKCEIELRDSDTEVLITAES